MQAAHPPLTSILAAFFKRLEIMEPIVRVILSQTPISAVLTFRGEPEERILLDFKNFPARVTRVSASSSGDIFMTIKAEVLHEILLGKITPGRALGEREMLLRGSPHYLARFIPLFAFGSVLYREHLADLGYPGFSRPSGKAPLKEMVMNDQVFKGDPIPVSQISGIERAIFKLFNGAAYLAGYLIGTARYRWFNNLSIFEALSSMSRGLQAASPAAGGATKETKS